MRWIAGGRIRLAYANMHPHPERPEQTVWEVFEEERPKLVAYRGRFDGFHAFGEYGRKNCDHLAIAIVSSEA
jgi:hypothetical protein